MAQPFHLFGLTKPHKSSDEEIVDFEFLDDDERQLIKKYLSLGDRIAGRRQGAVARRGAIVQRSQDWREKLRLGEEISVIRD